MFRPLPCLAVALIAAVGFSGCGIAKPKPSIPRGAAVITIEHMSFMPSEVEVRLGQPVVWKFDDPGVVHNAVDVSGPQGAPRFRSPDKEDGVWVHAFTTPGTYRYRCSLHPYMHGEVIVDP